MWRAVRVCNIVHFQYVALFLITLFELNLGLSDSNGIRTHNHLVRKQTLNQLAKWLSVRLQSK